MKTGKLINRIFIVLFICLCLIPSAGMLLFGESKAGSNEVLAAAPKLTEADGSLNTDVLEDTANWFADRFALRQQLITGWSWLNAEIFHTSVQDQVVLGSDGWLYFSDTLDDYTGVCLSETELDMLGNDLALLQEYAGSNGANFIFTVAPNKNSLYAEHMPGYITNRHGSSSLATLPELLEKYGIRYANLQEALSQATETLYYSTDTHWNAKGAALGADTILAALGMESQYAADSFSASGVHEGDLREMLYPTLSGNEPEITDDRVFLYQADGDVNGGNAITIRTENAAADGVLMCWRDSFGIALYPYLAESFGSATFSRSNTYDLLSAVGNGCDTVVIELVERNLDYLLTYMPVFVAPERELPDAAEDAGAVEIQETQGTTAATASMKLVKAELPFPEDTASVKVYFTDGGSAWEAYLLRTEDGLEACAWLAADTAADTVILKTESSLTAYRAA